MTDNSELDLRQMQMSIQSSINAAFKITEKNIIEKIREDSERGHKAIYDKIELKYDKQDENMSNMRDMFIERLDELNQKIEEMRHECIRREDVYLKGKEFLEKPRQTQEDFFNTKIGKAAIWVIAAGAVVVIGELVKKWIAA